MINQTISHYTILEKLGEGGMGVVYRAHDTRLDRMVALKFLPRSLSADQNEVDRFRHEARASAALTHHNICVAYEIGEHEGQLFLAIEYVAGKTLKKVVAEESPLTVRRVLEIAIQIADGLAAAHERGIVHRDIKSENIMLTPKGEVKIMDFGLAKLKGASKLTKEGSTLGTAAYMSPEQAQGEEVDHRSDIFSFGVVLYELLTGHLPFRGEHHAAILYALINEDPAPLARYNEQVPAGLERIVQKALAKEYEERYQHADDMMADLRHERKALDYVRGGMAVQQPVPARPAPEPVTAAPAPPAGAPVPARHNWMRLAMIAGAILVGTILLLVFNPLNFQVSMLKSNAGENNALAVMYFENLADPEDAGRTGEMLSNLLITSLSQASGLEVVSRERLYDIQKELGAADQKSIAAPLATQIAQRTGVGTMLLGTILQASPTFAVTYRLIDVQSGNIIRSERIAGFPPQRIFALADTMAVLVRNHLRAGSTGSPRDDEVRVANVTTSSPEAYRAYLEGAELRLRYYNLDAKAALEQAIALDSNFALAYYELARVGTGLWDAGLIRRSAERAWELRERTSERERLFIEALYNNFVQHSPRQAAEKLEELIEKFPHEMLAYRDLMVIYSTLQEHRKAEATGLRAMERDNRDRELINFLAYTQAGLHKREEALAGIDRYIQIAPAEANPHDSKGEIYLTFGENDSAVHCFKKALALRSDFESSMTLGNLYLLKRDYTRAEEYYRQYGMILDPGRRIEMELFLIRIAIHRGELKGAKASLREILSRNLPEGVRPRVQLLIAHLSQEIGEVDDVPKAVEAAMADWEEIVVASVLRGRPHLAWAYAARGDLQHARKILESMEHDLSDEVPITRAQYRFALGLVSFEEGKYDAAASELRSALESMMPNHAPQYHYAVALLKAGRLEEAMNELQRVTMWVGISFPAISLAILPMSEYWPITSVKAHYWLGVGYEQQGAKQKAIEEYTTFLATWKDADFRSPEMEDARLRLSKLGAVATR